MIWILGVFALALGVWLGLPGDRIASADESREALERGVVAKRKSKRTVMWLDYLFRGKKKSQVRERELQKSRRKPFDLNR